MTTLRIPIFALLAIATLGLFTLPALADKDESLDQLMTRVESARPEDRPALYLEIARRKAETADKLYDEGKAEAGNAMLQDVVAFSRKATDSAIENGKRLKNTEIMLRKMAEKFRDIKRTVAFDDQAPIQQTVDELEKMRTELLSAMFGKKKGK